MLRFVTFVDGSNLDGVLKHLNLARGRLRLVLSARLRTKRAVLGPDLRRWLPLADSAQHSRIYWYVVGKMDEWDLNDPKAERGSGPGSR